MTVLSQQAALGFEGNNTYGAAAATSMQLVEMTGDDWQREHTYIENQGFRKGQAALLTNRHRKIYLGAAGSLPHSLREQGELIVLAGLLGGSAKGSTANGLTPFQFWATQEGPHDSYTVQIERDLGGSSQQGFHYLGCIPTSFEISQPQEDVANVSVTYDAKSENKVASSAVVSSTNVNDRMFTAEDCEVFIGAAGQDAIGDVATSANKVADFVSFDVSGELMMKTDRRYLRGNALKDKPVRNGIPTFTGSLTAEFRNDDQYDRFVSGELFGVVIRWTSKVAVSSTHYPKFEIFMPDCRYTGSTPNSSLDDLTMITLPFTALYGGSTIGSAGANSPIMIQVTSRETSLPAPV